MEHYRVMAHADRYFIWVVKFHSLNELVHYYHNTTVNRGETVLLSDIVVRKGLSILTA